MAIVVLGALGQQPAGALEKYQTLQVTNNTSDDVSVYLNSPGWLTWAGADGICLWNSDVPQVLPDSLGCSPRGLSDNGYVVWAAYDDIWLWNGDTTANIGTDHVDRSPMINSSGTVSYLYHTSAGWPGWGDMIGGKGGYGPVLEGKMNWIASYNIDLSDSRTLVYYRTYTDSFDHYRRELRTYPGAVLERGDGVERPRINSSDHVVYLMNSSLYFWDGSAKTVLPDSAGATQHQINDFDQVVWEGPDGIHLWNVSTTQLLLGSAGGSNPQINNRGQVAWGTDNGIFLWNGVNTIHIPNTAGASAPRLNDAGQVAWTASDGNDSEVYLANPYTVPIASSVFSVDANETGGALTYQFRSNTLLGEKTYNGGSVERVELPTGGGVHMLHLDLVELGQASYISMPGQIPDPGIAGTASFVAQFSAERAQEAAVKSTGAFRIEGTDGEPHDAQFQLSLSGVSAGRGSTVADNMGATVVNTLKVATAIESGGGSEAFQQIAKSVAQKLVLDILLELGEEAPEQLDWATQLIRLKQRFDALGDSAFTSTYGAELRLPDRIVNGGGSDEMVTALTLSAGQDTPTRPITGLFTKVLRDSQAISLPSLTLPTNEDIPFELVLFTNAATDGFASSVSFIKDFGLTITDLDAPGQSPLHLGTGGANIEAELPWWTRVMVHPCNEQGSEVEAIVAERLKQLYGTLVEGGVQAVKGEPAAIMAIPLLQQLAASHAFGNSIVFMAEASPAVYSVPMSFTGATTDLDITLDLLLSDLVGGPDERGLAITFSTEDGVEALGVLDFADYQFSTMAEVDGYNYESGFMTLNFDMQAYANKNGILAFYLLTDDSPIKAGVVIDEFNTYDPVPEPATFSFLVLGGLLLLRRRRR